MFDSGPVSQGEGLSVLQLTGLEQVSELVGSTNENGGQAAIQLVERMH